MDAFKFTCAAFGLFALFPILGFIGSAALGPLGGFCGLVVAAFLTVWITCHALLNS